MIFWLRAWTVRQANTRSLVETFSENWFVYFFSSLLLVVTQQLPAVDIWIKIAENVTRLRWILFFGYFVQIVCSCYLAGEVPYYSSSFLLDLSFARLNKYLKFMTDWLINWQFEALLNPFWNHWLSLQSDWLSVVRFIHESHYFLL